jgi:hypothetical protein
MFEAEMLFYPSTKYRNWIYFSILNPAITSILYML